MIHYFALALLLIVGLTSIPCAQSKIDSGYQLDPASTFGLNVVNRLAGDQANDNKNVFISPLSIHSCLEMVYVGAAGKTKVDMADVLNLSGIDAQSAASSYATFTRQLQTVKDIPGIKGPGKSLTMEIANSLWARPDVRFVPNYSKLLTSAFNADAKTIDFRRADSVSIINNWVKQKTHNKIDSIVKTLDPATFLMLINSAYFKAHWDKVFDKKQTAPADFHLLSGQSVKANMMHRDGQFFYLEDTNVQAVKLSYTDDRFAMYVFLPRSNSDVNQFCQSLTPANWTGYMNSMNKGNGTLTLPRFKMSYELHLKKLLSQMGMPEAFTPGANFTQMTLPPPKPFIGDVIHKTYVNVDEDGTEAAAVTAAIMMGSSFMPMTPFVMNVDHPFFCAVTYEEQPGKQTILFAGKVMNPVSQ
ncbi:MAG: serpin family protein [Candidatus Obscuribacterales bacterium]|nr:serpin family protein [Candidatus Obscuribacterales bacterium]